MIHKRISTLVVLLGNARGGEKTWHSMYKNVLDPLNADLALLFGYSNNKSSSLYKRSKYIWEIEEYTDWGDYYKKRCKTNNWFTVAQRYSTSGIMGGIKGFKGSGAIIFALRDFLIQKREILQKYDRIILTRADYYYLKKHPNLSNNFLWVVEGEDYGGITDRHHVFPTKLLDQVLGVINFLDSDTVLEKLHEKNNYNPEKFLLDMFTFYKIDTLVKRFARVQFTVATKDDATRWKEAKMPMPGEKDLFLKYKSEYTNAIKNNKSICEILLSLFRDQKKEEVGKK